MIERRVIRAVSLALGAVWLMLMLFAITLWVYLHPSTLLQTTLAPTPENLSAKTWHAPDTLAIPADAQGDLIKYGRELVRHTSTYLGPSGSVAQISNGMNCQNCHLEAGTRLFGNNFSAVASTYPKFRARSGTIETISKRVNDCIERSLNGHALDTTSRELQAIVEYIRWVGKEVPKDSLPGGAGLVSLRWLKRPADPALGREVYEHQCSRCHGSNGEGQKYPNGLEWRYPPLWGSQSYNTGAGLYRLSRFAGYVKANMPQDLAATGKWILTDEQCWDVAAFVNTMPRPVKDISMDWPDISKKPFDHPFGPYTDTLSEKRHKYGPPLN